MFTKRKSNKGAKSKNVNFELPSVSQSEVDDCVPGFYFGSSGSMSHLNDHPLPWKSSGIQESGNFSQEEVNKIITPSDRFDRLLSDDGAAKTPEVFVSVDTHHFDEDDYRNHRHRIYPHMHQPLKSMEPRVLRKIKEKIRENKSLQVRAATAGVPTSVPQLLAKAADSRVLIDSSGADRSRVVSGPVLTVVRAEELGHLPESPLAKEDAVMEPCPKNDPVIFDETLLTFKVPTVTGKKKKKRKKRVKKQEPFQPTLGKLSEESSSPMLSGTEELICLECDDDDDDDDDEFEDDFDDEQDRYGDGGLILEELGGILSSDRTVDDCSMDDDEDNDSQRLGALGGRIRRHNSSSSSEQASLEGSSGVSKLRTRKLSFLEEIASTDNPIGFLDMTLQTQYTRKYSMPTFTSVDPLATVTLDSARETMSSAASMTSASSHEYATPLLLPPTVLPAPHVFTAAPSTSLTSLPLVAAAAAASSCQPHCNFQIGSGSTDSVAANQRPPPTTTPTSSPPLPPLLTDRSFSQPSGEHVHHRSGTKPRSRHHHHHHHHHHKEHYTKRDLEKRTFSGQDMRSLWQSNELDQLDEYQSMLGDAIIDDMKSHRCYDMPALNRSRIRNRYVQTKKTLMRSRSVTHTHGEAPADKSDDSDEKHKKCITCSDERCHVPKFTKSQEDLIFQSNVSHTDLRQQETIDGDSLPLFVEMDILKPHKYWREVSRWVRYEQVYNEFSDTFGKAHSSPLKFTAFTQFRVQMEDALFLPNVEATTLADAIAQLTEELLVNQLFTEPRESYFVKEVFRWRRVHAGEKVGSMDEDAAASAAGMHDRVRSDTLGLMQHWLSPSAEDANMRAVNTTPGNMNNSYRPASVSGAKCESVPNPVAGKSVSAGATDIGAHKFSGSSGGAGAGQHSNIPFVLKVFKNSIPLKWHSRHHYKSDLEGHLPPNTEGVAVQVGEVPALRKPFLAIIRFKTPLTSSAVDPPMTELSDIPIRFLVVCLGPPAKLQYEEVGRVISTMMINKDFRRLMYRATDKYEIIDGLYKYLDTCFVLSYSDRHPARNMHTMVDHIHDFMRLHHSGTTPNTAIACTGSGPPPQISSARSFPRDLESGIIKHSASVNWADEQKAMSVRQRELSRSYVDGKQQHKDSEDPEKGGSRLAMSNQQLLPQQVPLSADSRGDVSKVTFRMNLDGDDEPDSNAVLYTHKKRKDPCRQSDGLCRRLWFFLFRLLRLDWMLYRDRFVSDYKDALKPDNVVIVLCGLLYLYFVCLSPALTFGALLGDLVSSQFTVQSVLACNGCLLILFSILAGNPMVVIGITGPMFLMETVISKMANNFSVEIMLYRFLIALYVASLGLVSLAFNITWILQKVRRSVEECFNAFIGLYFIFKAILTIIKIFSTAEPVPIVVVIAANNSSTKNVTADSRGTTSQHRLYLYNNRIAIGFASLVLAYTMYQICVALNSVKRGRFFTRKFRKMVDYFNVAIGILVLSLVNVLIVHLLGVSLPTLSAEVGDASWVVVPQFSQLLSSATELSMAPSVTAHLVAVMLAFALLSLSFTETAIAGISVTKTERRLVKPSLFAQDQFVCLCVIPLICGSLGWPFLSGAAVRSTSYVISMTKWDQKVVPGVRHKIIGVAEQRVTLMIVGVLVLATVTVESLLRFIPVSAMLGMFFYMGVMAIRDLVVTRRLITMFKRCKHWKDHEYLKDIPPNVLRVFEVSQLMLIGLMFCMNCIAEFSEASWTTFLIPLILLLYALAREILLPRIGWLSPHLDKLDPRHSIHVAALCPGSHRHRPRLSPPPLSTSSVSSQPPSSSIPTEVAPTSELIVIAATAVTDKLLPQVVPLCRPRSHDDASVDGDDDDDDLSSSSSSSSTSSSSGLENEGKL